MSDIFPNKNYLKKKKRCFKAIDFKLCLNCAIRRVQVYQNGMKINGTHQILVCADDVNILGGSVHTIKENTETLVDDTSSKEIELVVNADKTKHMVSFEIRMQDEVTM